MDSLQAYLLPNNLWPDSSNQCIIVTNIILPKTCRFSLHVLWQRLFMEQFVCFTWPTRRDLLNYLSKRDLFLQIKLLKCVRYSPPRKYRKCLNECWKCKEMSTAYEKGGVNEIMEPQSQSQRVFAHTDKYCTSGQDIRSTLMVPLWRHDLHWNKIHIFLLFMLSLTVFAWNI
jgi:hypothetical protein